MAKKKKKKPHYGFFSSQNRLEKDEKERKLKLSFRSVPNRRIIENSKKKAKKLKKLKKWNYGFFSSQNRWEKNEKKRKYNLSFVSVPSCRVIENSKKEWQENWEILKKTIMASFQAKIGWKRPRRGENKNFCSIPLLPDA